MNLANRLKKIEREVGPLSYHEWNQATRRQHLRLKHILYHNGISAWAAWSKANPDREDDPTEIELASIEVEKPPEVDMNPKSFARDQDIIDAFLPEHRLERQTVYGRSENEMIKYVIEFPKRIAELNAKSKALWGTK